MFLLNLKFALANYPKRGNCVSWHEKVILSEYIWIVFLLGLMQLVRVLGHESRQGHTHINTQHTDTSIESHTKDVFW